jgi:NADPH:quinone reductase-like Zn-dependent oxidoreductase
VARKILFYETGGPEMLKIVEVPPPEPGAGEIRMRVKAIGLNRSEVTFVRTPTVLRRRFLHNSVRRFPVRSTPSERA